MTPHSKLFNNIRQIVTEKDRLFTADSSRRDKERLVRSFYNGQSLYSEEELKDLGKEENTNHLLGYRNLAAIQESIASIYTGTRTFIEVSANFGDSEVDARVSSVLTRYLNEAIYYSGRFEAVWQSVAGEICITGRAPLVFDRHGWCPRIAPNLLLPEESAPAASGVDYAFAPYELTIARLNALAAAVKRESGVHINLTAVEQVIAALEQQIAEGRSQTITTGDNRGKEELERALNEGLPEADANRKIKAWKYYERWYNDDKKCFSISCTLFTEEIPMDAAKKLEPLEPLVISSVKTEYTTPEEWLHIIVADSQIGGRKTYGDTVGIAELTFNSDAQVEELLNTQIAGDLQRASVKWRATEQADAAVINRWDVMRDHLIPRGVEPVQVYTAGNLLTPINLLTQTSSGLSGGSYSNSGRNQELRAQAVERQNQSAGMANGRLSAIATAGHRLAAEIVRRFLLDKITPRHEEYNDVMWFRSQVQAEDLGVTFAELGKVEFGRFKHLRVHMAQAVGDGSRHDESQIATALMENYNNFPPEARPVVLKRWVTMLTRNPRLADDLVEVPKAILNAQRVTAENEFDTIRRRAALGERLPIADDDVDENHLATHAKDIEAFIASLNMRKPEPLDAVQLTGAFDHAALHLERMDSMEVSRNAATAWRGVLSNLADQARPILAALEQEQSAQAEPVGMTEKEKADFALKQGALVINAQKVGLAQAAHEELIRARQERSALLSRKQYSAEVQAAEKLKLAKKQAANKPKKTSE